MIPRPRATASAIPALLLSLLTIAAPARGSAPPDDQLAADDGASRLCWDIGMIWREILVGLGMAARGGAVSSIGVDSWAVDYGLVDGAGELVAPVTSYRDTLTFTLPQLPGYKILAPEQVDIVVPAPAIVSRADVPASPAVLLRATPGTPVLNGTLVRSPSEATLQAAAARPVPLYLVLYT